MTPWNDMIIGICLLLSGWLLWKEFRRPDRLRLTARIIASVVAVISLACMALPLSYRGKKGTVSSGKEGVLLTEGYDPDSLRQFLQREQAGGGGSISGRPKVFSVADGPALSEVAALHVLGYGLTRKEWASLHPPPLVFHPSPSPTGILSVSWKQKLTSGEKLRIQGRVSLTPGKPVKLLLTGMGLPLDSVFIGPGTQGKSVSEPDTTRRFVSAGQIDFELNTIPAQSGRSVYRLWVLSGGGAGAATSSGANTRMDTLEQESIPIEVLPAKKLRILLLAAAPDFENTFLVNWLSRSGHAVATRTIISKGKSDKAFLNMPKVALEPLTAAVLDKFDLVIADAAVLQSGDAAEGSTLRRQIMEKGLGLIIKADSLAADPGASNNPAGATFYKDLFRVEAVKDSTQRLTIKERPGTQPLLRDSSSRILVSSGLYGSGKLVITTLNETYSRMLSGEKKEYRTYWSLVLQKAVRDAEPGEDWQFKPDLPRVNEPVEALLQTNRSGLPQGQFSAVDDRTDSGNAALSARTVYLAQSPLWPFQWQGTYWPALSGWQSSATSQGEPFWWYAWAPEDWRSIHRIQRWKETEEYIARQQALNRTGSDTAINQELATPPDPGKTDPMSTGRPITPQGDGSERVPISPVWFYVLFIMSCLFLWVERKI